MICYVSVSQWHVSLEIRTQISLKLWKRKVNTAGWEVIFRLKNGTDWKYGIEIKTGIAMAMEAFNNKKNLFFGSMDLKWEGDWWNTMCGVFYETLQLQIWSLGKRECGRIENFKISIWIKWIEKMDWQSE